MNREFKKNIAIIVLAIFVFFWDVPGVLVLAEEPSPTPEPTPEVIEQTPEPTPEATPFSTPSPTPIPDTIIETGDAQSDLDIETETNSNVLTTPTEEQQEEEIASQSQDFEPIPFDQPASSSSGIENLTSENQSQAEIANTGSSSAGTGQNEGSSSSGNAIIVTGNANAQANIINVANTNIIDSQGLFLLYNIFSQYWSNLDLREWIEFDPTSGCPSGCEVINNLNVLNTSTASISNDITVSASTGENTASSGQGNSTILTGDANAAANVVNVVNTNIVGSNYILLALNNFTNWFGDLILPSQMFLEKLIGQPIQTLNNNEEGTAINIQNENGANVENETQSSADTGNNEAQTGSGNSAILTGNAQSSTNTLNVVNQNIFDSNSLFILIRVYGNWRGNIFNLPSSAGWQQNSDGISIYGTETNSESNISVSNTNQASIKNNINVFALTGNNKVVTLEGDGAILTGNANAAANIVNIVNTNIFGRNWLFALINIFGNWQGNLSFGQPDLWIGGEVDSGGAENPLPGHHVSYNFTVINKGDAAASNIQLKTLFDEYQNLDQYSPADKQDDNQLAWNLGTLQPGESTTVTYSANIKPDISVGYSTLNTWANVSSYETDANMADNQELLSFRVFQPFTDLNGSILNNSQNNSGSGQGAPSLKITKTNDATGLIKPQEHIKFTIKLINEGSGSAYDVVVKDKLYDPLSQIIHEEEWTLGEVFANEEIIMDYTIEINGNGETGKYVNTAYTGAVNYNGEIITTVYASSSFDFIGSEEEKENDSANANNDANNDLNDNGSGLEKAAETVLGSKAEAKQEIVEIREVAETMEETSGNNLFGSILLSMFGFFNEIPPAILALGALLILALILLAIKRKKDEQNSEE